MIPLDAEATEAVLAWGDALHRTVALHHASLRGRPGLWGDDPRRPSSVVWIRDGGDRWEIFGAGFVRPALDWIIDKAVGRPIVLAAPPSWEAPVRARVDRVEQAFVQTWLRPDPPEAPTGGPRARRLDLADEAAFLDLAPLWAVGSWGDFGTLIDEGAAFGVEGRDGRLASVAWVVESDHHRDKVGVATREAVRRLGLGRASASALVEHVEHDRHRHPLWVVSPANMASMALARSLGFSAQLTEPLLRWTPPA